MIHHDDQKAAKIEAAAYRAMELFEYVEKQKWCIIPPNEETTEWRIYATFDDEGGYQDEISGGETLLEALEEAIKFVADDRAWCKGPPTPESDSTAST